MDWITLLKAQQFDFLQRLKSGYLFNCNIEGQHSELTVISGENLDQLRDFCWEMVRRYRSNDPKNCFINNMKGKLAEEVIKTRLSDLVTEVDYETRINGDGKIDFTLTADSSIGIQVKARHGSFDTVQWSISKEEINKNAVLVCILIQEKVSEAQSVYNLILAGFLPTNMIVLKDNKGVLDIETLMYSGGLRSYLENLILYPNNAKAEEKVKSSSIEVDKTSCNEPVNSYTGNQFAKLVLEYFNLANSYYKQNQYESAVSYYNKVLELNPYFVDAYFGRGISFYVIKDYQKAIQDFNSIIFINPNEYKVYSNRGLALFAINNINEAIQDFTNSISILTSHTALAYYYRGVTNNAVGKFQQAIEDYTQSITINPNFDMSYLERGIARSSIRDRQGAINDYTQAIKINPKCDNVYFLRGVNYFKIGHKNEAIHDYTQAININDKNDEYYLNCGYARYTVGDKEGSIEDYTHTISINPNLAVAFTKRGTAHYKLGDIKGAIKDYTSAIKLNQKDSITYLNRSFCYYKTGNTKLAINDYNQALNFSSKLANSRQAHKLKNLLYPSNNLQLVNNTNLELLIPPNDENEDEYDDSYININNSSEYQDRQLDYGYLEDLDNDDYYYYFKGCSDL
ncbi:tetratricopeptide repeat protein [Nostoc sp.]|uniref:tetratricopeptide repeat protein n=1 Tax=Nostoc sp. TaxID=1180 RepID=UPI002FF6D53A